MILNYSSVILISNNITILHTQGCTWVYFLNVFTCLLRVGALSYSDILSVRFGMLVCPSCLILCDPMDCGPPGSSVHGISQARILQWVAISFSRGYSRPTDRAHNSCNGRQIRYWPLSLPSIRQRFTKVKVSSDSLFNVLSATRRGPNTVFVNVKHS